MNTSIKSVYDAAQILGLGENETLIDINRKYRDLLFRWHPDHCRDLPQNCREKTGLIIDAYKIIMEYCSSQKFSFNKETLEKTHPGKNGPSDFWHEHFGGDALWGYSKKPDKNK